MFSQKFVYGNILNPKDAGTYHSITYPNINQFVVTIRGGTPSATTDFTGVVAGIQNI
jgi:hypothetical protein